MRTLRTLLRARDQGLNPGNLATIPSTISTVEQIRQGTRNAEILLKLVWAIKILKMFLLIKEIYCFIKFFIQLIEG